MKTVKQMIDCLVGKSVLNEEAARDFLTGGCNFCGEDVQTGDVMALYGYIEDYQGYQKDFWEKFGISEEDFEYLLEEHC